VTYRTTSPADRPAASGVVNVGIHGVDGSWVGNQNVPVTGGAGEWHNYVSWNAQSTVYLPAWPTDANDVGRGWLVQRPQHPLTLER
jgi:hypothetical protein